MSNMTQKVPYGYEPPADQPKGTLIYYDSFEHTTEEDLDAASHTATDRSFARFVIYPLHEETVKRMSKSEVSPYFRRVKRLTEWKEDRGLESVEIDGWEGKRKKYTPMEAALRHLTETLPGPHFILISPENANLFASYVDFEQWIVKIRLMLTEEPTVPHPRLEEYRSRWNSV